MAIAGVGLMAGAMAAEFKFGRQTLTLPEGFEIELVAGPPLVDRPMMAEFDEQGRLYVADSAGSNEPVQKQLETKPHRIVRLEDTDGDGRYDKSVVFADKLMFPEGVLWHEGAVYTGAPPTIWKLEDTDGDGVADRRTEWFKGLTLTGCANDLHGPYLGPDGWIYWCKGAFAAQTHERPGRRTISDSAAHVFRSRPDGSEFDSVMSGGMDNPVELAFTPTGEVFFITTFFHHPEAGKRDAIAHCIYGGVYPKVHGVLDGLQRTGELLPPLVELGPAAACALTRYDADTFGPEYQGNLFSTLFNLRKVMRHVLTPVAGTYVSKDEDFLVSDQHDFHPTDVFEDADGSLLVIDTGGWYKICCPTSQLAKPDVLGAIYRVKRKGMPHVADPRGLKLAWATMTPKDEAALLADPRPAVRKRAVQEVARKGAAALPALAEVLAQGTTPLARQNAIWALTRIDGTEARGLTRQALADRDEEVQLTALHAVGLRRDREALPALLPFLMRHATFAQRKAAEALGRIGDKEAVPALLAAAGGFGDWKHGEAALRIQEHAVIYALIEIADPASTRAGLTAASVMTRRAALIALDQMDGGALTATDVAPLLAANDAVLKATGAWIAEQHPAWGEALAGGFRERLLTRTPAEKELGELNRQLTRFGRNPAIQVVMAGVLANGTVPVATRLMVLRAMANTGVRETPDAWRRALPGPLADANEELVRQAVTTVRSLPLNRTNSVEVTAALKRLAGDEARPLALRVEAMGGVPGGLPALDPAAFDLVLQALDPGQPPAVRGAAARTLTRAKLTESQQLAVATAVKDVGPMEVNGLLEALDGANSEAIGQRLIQSLEASKALPSVRGDLLQRRLAGLPPGLQPAGKALLVRLDIDPEKQAARLDAMLTELKDGDIRRGQEIFNSPKTACSTCHMMGYVGGRVGPDLTSIGQIRTERDLLEAVVYPSASFVRSYEPVIVSTKDEEEYSGVVVNDTPEELVLATGANTQARVPKANLASQRPGAVSVMPTGLAEQLSRQEMADLLAFLKASRPGAR